MFQVSGEKFSFQCVRFLAKNFPFSVSGFWRKIFLSVCQVSGEIFSFQCVRFQAKNEIRFQGEDQRKRSVLGSDIVRCVCGGGQNNT